MSGGGSDFLSGSPDFVGFDTIDIRCVHAAGHSLSLSRASLLRTRGRDIRESCIAKLGLAWCSGDQLVHHGVSMRRTML